MENKDKKIKCLDIDIYNLIYWMDEKNKQKQKQINLNNFQIEYFSHLKLHKLLYFIEGCFLAKYNISLFNDDFKAWDDGPVISKLYGDLKHDLNLHKNSLLLHLNKYKKDNFNEDFKKLSDEQIEFLENVFNFFNAFSAWELTEYSHLGGTWPKTQKDEIIQKSEMIEDFKILLTKF